MIHSKVYHSIQQKSHPVSSKCFYVFLDVTLSPVLDCWKVDLFKKITAQKLSKYIKQHFSNKLHYDWASSNVISTCKIWLFIRQSSQSSYKNSLLQTYPPSLFWLSVKSHFLKQRQMSNFKLDMLLEFLTFFEKKVIFFTEKAIII